MRVDAKHFVNTAGEAKRVSTLRPVEDGVGNTVVDSFAGEQLRDKAENVGSVSSKVDLSGDQSVVIDFVITNFVRVKL